MHMYLCSAYFLIISVALLCVNCLPKSGKTLTCKDGSGLTVDWFIAYKPPHAKNPESQLLYMDSQKSQWRKLDANVFQKNNPLATTLYSIYKDEDQDDVYVMYNDQLTNKSSSIFGHTKGVINFDTKSGYWLVHSVPKFPPPKSSGQYNYTESGLKYGQIFLCLSLGYEYLDTIGHLFLYNHPQIYDHLLPERFKRSNPNITSVIEGKFLQNTELLSLRISSLGGQTFSGFAKCSEYDEDLWIGIAKFLKTGLVVETWGNGAQKKMPSYCEGAYKVENLRSLSVLDFDFDETQDHAKWGVSKKGKDLPELPREDAVVRMHSDASSWICIGDINRQCSQKSRGGGAVCFDNTEVAANFQGSLRDVEGCKKCPKAYGLM